MYDKVNRIKLVRLYSIPEIFDDIPFCDGINIILGEKSNEINAKSKKTNGVGKSVCLDFINFCLLKDYEHTRLSKISSLDLDPNVLICLDLFIGYKYVVIKREIANNSMISITVDKEQHEFVKVSDACTFLETLIFNNKVNISFRRLLSSLTREEKIDYVSVLRYHSSPKIPDDPTPLLFMLDVDTNRYNESIDLKRKYDKQLEIRLETKKSLTQSTGQTIAEIQSDLNEKEKELKESLIGIEKLKSNEIFKTVENDIVVLEGKLKSLRDDRMVLKTRINQIESLPKPERINGKEMKDVYNFFKSGLGDYIVKSLDEVKEFKSVIEKYQETLVSEKFKDIKKELYEIEEKIRKIENAYKEKLDMINFDNDSLNYLKCGLTSLIKEQDEFNIKKSTYNLYNKTEIEIGNLKTEYGVATNELNKSLMEMFDTVDLLENQLVEFHTFVMGDSRCSLSIKVDQRITTKNLIDIDVRITDDGSFSVDRIKVFLYDISLMFNDATRKRHPKFLIHDNIFLMDDDSTEKSLDLLLEMEGKYSDFQYITTLNVDNFNNLDVKDRLISTNKIVARFTKTSKFLKKDYKEI